MPRIKSAKKRVEITERNRERNRSWKAAVRTAATQVEKSADDKKAGQTALVSAYSIIDRAVNKGILHKNAAARKKSQLAKKIAP